MSVKVYLDYVIHLRLNLLLSWQLGSAYFPGQSAWLQSLWTQWLPFHQSLQFGTHIYSIHWVHFVKTHSKLHRVSITAVSVDWTVGNSTLTKTLYLHSILHIFPYYLKKKQLNLHSKPNIHKHNMTINYRGNSNLLQSATSMSKKTLTP